MPTLRATSPFVYANNTSSVTVALPSGSTAGDTCLLFAGHGYGINTPSGWTSLDNLTGTNVNGAVCQKILSASDISSGSVTVTFANVYYGVVTLASIVGSVDTFLTSSRNTTGSTSRTITSQNTAKSGSLGLWFSMGRANITITCNVGSQAQTSSNANASGILNAQTFSSVTAHPSASFTYSTAPSGDYEAVVLVSDITPGFSVSKAAPAAWIDPNAGFAVSKAAAGAWTEPKPGFDVSKASSAAWVEPKSGFDASKTEVLAWIEPGMSRRRQLINT